MQNWHRHSSFSNLYTPDSAALNEEYAKRAVELGHKTISSVEHGWQGYYFQTYELAKKYGLKPIIGAEAYWVKDRLAEYEHKDSKGKVTMTKDRGNHHILLLAKSNEGRESINDILSEANISGYYYKPRVDLPLILSLPPKDVIVTSACIAFSGYEDTDDIILQLHEHFGENFLLEVQYHNTDAQKKWNQHLLELSEKHNIELSVGLDSHYILPEDTWKRDYILEAKGVHYEDEEGWYLDYPDDDEVVRRFKEQGVLSDAQIKNAMDKTNISLEFCDYDKVRVFTKDIKLPSLYPNETKEQKDKRYSKLISREFKKYMAQNLPDISKEEYQRYFDGVKAEIQTYKDTGMVDYPLLDYEIIKDAVKHGGLITDTGRGSAVGFFTNTLCGFSKVDRFTSAIKLYPERFISTTRILETHSLPDIDMNVGNVEVFEESQKRVLGEEHVAPMIAFGTLKKKSAFKIYAKATGMDFDLANEITSQIDEYEQAVKNDDDGGDDINIYDYVDEKYQSYIEGSEKYWGVISDKKKAPSAYLLYDGNVRREIGLMKCKSETTGKEYIVCCMDGAVAENYKFLKNDLLKVDVVLLIAKVFDRIGIEHFNVNTLIKKVHDDQKVWDLYAKGYTLGLNQVEKEGSKHKCMNYKPSNISELSAFVAAIRPGFKSMYRTFEKREDFSWGIPSLDNLLRTEELPVSFLFFQEQVMSVLNYAGFPMDECYGIIKAIAKKHPEKVRPLKQRFIDGFREKLITDEHLSSSEAQESAEAVWVIINDNCGYGFNCVIGSTKIMRGASNAKFVPTVEEMYKIRNDYEYAKKTNHLALRKKYRRYGYGQALSMFDDLKIHPNRIVGIQEAGYQQTYELKTKHGSSIICTANHKFPTMYGEKPLKDLQIGDLLFCIDQYKKRYFNSNLTDGTYEKNYHISGQCGFQTNPNGASVIYDTERDRHQQNYDCCELCGKAYTENARFELHHKDFDRHNNTIENYQWLCVSCHKKIHYQYGRTKRYENGISTFLDEIISIEPKGVEMTYDIEMDDPAHNFLTENGLVTSNSAHAYCMALDSLYQAWQKANYPYEFYEVLLNHYTEKGNKDKVTALKTEMKTAFGIIEGEYKFRADNRKFTADAEKGVIYPSLISIKGIGQNVSDKLYNLRDKQYNDFLELLIDLRKKGQSISTNIIENLIKIGYFSEFGGINELLVQFEWFQKLYGRKQFTALDLEKMGVDVDLATFMATKVTDKKIVFDDMLPLIRETVVEQEIAPTKVMTRINYQFEILGYIQTILPDFDEDYYVITSMSGTSARVVHLYQVSTGDTIKLKIRKKAYDEQPVEVGDWIKAYDMTNEKKWIVDGETPDGKPNFKQIDEKENILKKFALIT